MPPKHIFKGETFAISGSLSQPQKDYEELIQKHGGEVASSLTKAVTFLISTEADVKACSTKVATAQGRGTPILQEGFIGACIAAKKFLDPKKFAIAAAAGAKKRKGAAAKTAPSKKARTGPVVTADGVKVIEKSGLAGKAAVVQEDIAKGFMKASLTWDVELVLNDPSKAKDKYYNMQLLAAKEGHGFWAVQHWGRTGTLGTVHIDGPFPDVDSAKRIFKKKYRAKTGNAWGTLGSFVEIPGKYKVLVRETADPKAPGLWQYYMHNSVDGKRIGWYDYEAAQTESMEKYWHQFTNNDGLEIRFIQTDYFKYEVNFKEMIQTNTKSGTRRVIRRTPAGEKPSPAKPDVIPDPVAPAPAAAAAETSDEEEEDDVEPEDDEEDEEETADDDGEKEAEEDVDEAEDKGHVDEDTEAASPPSKRVVKEEITAPASKRVVKEESAATVADSPPPPSHRVTKEGAPTVVASGADYMTDSLLADTLVTTPSDDALAETIAAAPLPLRGEWKSKRGSGAA